MKKFIVALAAAGALTAATALPVSADPLADGDYFPEVNGVTWGMFHEDEGGDGFNIDDAYTDIQNDAYDSAGYFAWYDVAGPNWSDYLTCMNADLSAATDVTSDYILTCDTQLDVFPDIDSEISGRLYGEGDLFRLEYTLTNNSDLDFDFSWNSQSNYGCGIDEDENTVDFARGFDIQSYDADCTNQSYYDGIAFGTPGARLYPTDDGSVDTIDDRADIYGPVDAHVVLTPGESATVVIFLFHGMTGSDNGYPSDSFGSLTEWAADQFAAWPDERLTRGIADPDIVANWTSTDPSDPSTPENRGLASTGVDATGSITFGVLALAAGVALVFARRRRTV